MRMPDMMPARLRVADQPIYALVGSWDGAIMPAADALTCAACCAGKAGFGACVARCMATGQACDGGLTNCTPC